MIVISSHLHLTTTIGCAAGYQLAKDDVTKEFIKLVVEERVTGHQWMKENIFLIGSEHDKKTRRLSMRSFKHGFAHRCAL